MGRLLGRAALREAKKHGSEDPPLRGHDVSCPYKSRQDAANFVEGIVLT